MKTQVSPLLAAVLGATFACGLFPEQQHELLEKDLGDDPERLISESTGMQEISRHMCVPISSKNKDMIMDGRRHLTPELDDKFTVKYSKKNVTAFHEFSSQLSYLSSSECKQSKRLRIRPMENGVGSTVFSLVKPILHAMTYGYCIETPRDFKLYTDEENDGKWGRYFKGMSKVIKRDKTRTAQSTGETGLEKLLESKDGEYCNEWWENQCDYFCDYGDSKTDLRIKSKRTSCEVLYSHHHRGDEMLPKVAKPLGFFYTVSHIVSLVFRPSAVATSLIEQRKERLGWPKDNKIISLHVRLGDACLKSQADEHGRSCNQLGDYMDNVKTMSKKYNISTIYLATDGNSAVEDTAKYPEYTWLVDLEVRREGNRRVGVMGKDVPKTQPVVAIEESLHSGRVNGTREFLNVMSDIVLLSSSTAMVGKFTSSIFRLAYMLNFVSRGYCYPPMTSLDSAWCFDHSLKTGVSDKGNFWC